MRTSYKLATAALGAAALLPFGMVSALAADGNATARQRPIPLNGANASGTAMVEVNGNTISVTMAANGLLADQPHAAHIHFGADARHECPVAGDDAKKDGHLNTTDGAPKRAEIRLVTCGGAFDQTTGHYVDNIVVFGHLLA